MRHAHVPTVDIFSYTHPAASWVAYEWLSDLSMATLENAGDLNLVAVGSGGLIAFLFLMLYEQIRENRCHFLLAFLLCLVGALASSVHWLARPHLFTLLGCYCVATILEKHYRGTIFGTRFFLSVALLMIVWVNCHPGFIVGFLLLGIYGFCTFTEALIFSGEEKRIAVKKFWNYMQASVLALVCCCANPYGLHLFAYTARYLQSGSLISKTVEYMSPLQNASFSTLNLKLLFAIFVIVLSITSRKLSFPKLVACLVFAAGALVSTRNVPIFVVVVLPALGELLSSISPMSAYLGSSLSDRDKPLTSDASPVSIAEHAHNRVQLKLAKRATWWQTLLRQYRHLGRRFDVLEHQCRSHAFSYLSMGLLSLLAICHSPVLATGFSSRNMPSATLDYLKNHIAELPANGGFNYDNWGGFLYYELGRPVFIDDRADFYGEAFYNKYISVIEMQPGYEKLLDELKIKWILFPADAKLVTALKSSGLWHQVASDSASCLLIRSPN